MRRSRGSARRGIHHHGVAWLGTARLVAAKFGALTRMLSARFRAERGSASLEFLGLGVVLLIPIAYGTVALVQLEQARLATDLGARNGARVLVTGSDAAAALAEQHIALALHDHGIDPAAARIEIRCAPNPDCAVAGDTLTVTVRTEVPLPFVPGAAEWLTIPVESSATYPRDRFEAMQ